MDEEYELVDSPLSTTVSSDGFTVEVRIYRGKDDAEWVLEVVDHDGGSTVWSDPFPTDQAALDEVTLTIERDGIASFLRDPSQKPH